MYQAPGNPASGFGDGLYQIRARMEGPGLGSGSGPALVLWPADDRWPGPEIDIGEIGGGGDLYMATHWNNNGQDAYNIYSAPGVDWRQWHDYAARLETNRITYYVDGRQIGVETQHPAPEYGEGGVNHIPSVMNRSSETMLEVDYFRFTDESALVDRPAGRGRPGRGKGRGLQSRPSFRVKRDDGRGKKKAIVALARSCSSRCGSL